MVGEKAYGPKVSKSFLKYNLKVKNYEKYMDSLLEKIYRKKYFRKKLTLHINWKITAI